MTDYGELKRLANACPPPGTYHYQSKEWASLMEFQTAVEDIYESDVGMAKELIAEVEALHSQVATLQSDSNSWQSGYDEGRRIGTKTALDEREQLRKDAERYRFLRGRRTVGDLELAVAMINQKTRQHVFLDGRYVDTRVDAAMSKGNTE